MGTPPPPGCLNSYLKIRLTDSPPSAEKHRDFQNLQEMWSIIFMTITNNKFKLSHNISQESPPIRFSLCSPPNNVIWASISRTTGYPPWSSCVFPEGIIRYAHQSPYLITDWSIPNPTLTLDKSPLGFTLFSSVCISGTVPNNASL